MPKFLFCMCLSKMYAFARSFPMATGSPDFSVVVICYYKVEFLFGKQGWRRVVHSPPTIVAGPGSTPYVGWVCCWFFALLREGFLRVLRFSPLLKNQHFQNERTHFNESLRTIIKVSWEKKLQYYNRSLCLMVIIVWNYKIRVDSHSCLCVCSRNSSVLWTE